jgi:metal-responsive CopG/Arc/MetJ family transcriptional regulator
MKARLQVTLDRAVVAAIDRTGSSRSEFLEAAARRELARRTRRALERGYRENAEFEGQQNREWSTADVPFED